MSLTPAAVVALLSGDHVERRTSRDSEVVRARPLDEWQEDMGDVVWWKFPICEPPYLGDPRSDDWPGYHTHWTPIVYPREPEEARADA